MKEIFNTKTVLLFGLIIIALPILINLFFLSWGTAITFGETNSWIGFFGSYLGSTIGGLLTLMGVVITLNSKSAAEERSIIQKKIRLLYLLIDENSTNKERVTRLIDGKIYADPTDDNEVQLPYDLAMFLEDSIWKQLKSDALLLLNQESIIELTKTYENVYKYNVSAIKKQGHVKEIVKHLKSNEEMLNDSLKQLLRKGNL